MLKYARLEVAATGEYSRAVRLAAVIVLVASCASPPAFPVPEGPPRRVVLDVQLPVYGLGTWSTAGFTQTLRQELAKYNIVVVEPSETRDAIATIDLGRWTYRTWQEIDVTVGDDRRAVVAGRIRVPDLSMTTTDVAAEMVATLIARKLWAVGEP
jgi:hypothetical protein